MRDEDGKLAGWDLPHDHFQTNISNCFEPMPMLTVNSCIKVCLDLQVDKSPVTVKGPFFPRVVNPRYRIRGTNA
jgi:hypothetical protein